MSGRLKLLWTAGVALVAGLLLGALLFRMPASSTGDSKPRNEKIVLITHGQASDPYWNIVRHGAEDAARQLGVKLDYRAPETFDMIRMAELVTSATNQKPNGIIMSIPDANALAPAMRSAASSGIPIVSINSGADVSKWLGALIHVGQDEYQTGKKVGERLKGAGAHKIACINPEVGNTALDARCRGVQDGFGGPVTVIPTTTDFQEAKSKVAAALAGDTSVDAVVTLSAALLGEPALSAAEEARRPIMVASFDLSPAFLKAVENGKALFAVDPQPYLQGYLSTVLLANYVRYGVMPANPLIESGPKFIGRNEARKVLALSQEAIR